MADKNILYINAHETIAASDARRVRRVGVSGWFPVDWGAASIHKDDKGADDGGSVANADGSATLKLANATTTNMTSATAAARTGIIWMREFRLPQDLDFRRHRLMCRGQIDMPVDSQPQNTTAVIFIAADNDTPFDTGFIYCAAHRQQAGAGVILNREREENAADSVIAGPSAAFDRYMISIDGAVLADSLRPYTRTTNVSETRFLADLALGASDIIGVSMNAWDRDHTHIDDRSVYVGIALHSDGNLLGAAAEATFRSIEFQWVDLFPEQV